MEWKDAETVENGRKSRHSSLNILRSTDSWSASTAMNQHVSLERSQRLVLMKTHSDPKGRCERTRASCNAVDISPDTFALVGGQQLRYVMTP